MHQPEASLLPTTTSPSDTAPSTGRAIALALLGLVALFAVAWVPRVIALDRHATADEDLTLIRSANVALAIERGDWWETYQIGHPEATVQLLVALTLGPDRLRPYAGEFIGPDARTAARAPGYLDTLVAARSVMVPVHAGLIVLAGLLCWRVWGTTTGVLVGLVLALEPFLVAHGRILRTDALLAELMLVAVLAALAYWSSRGGTWALGLCALATGLALLTKTPALALLGAVPAAAVAGLRAARTCASTTPPECPGDGLTPRRAGLGSLTAPMIRLLGGLAAWAVGSAAVVAIWPAMWARPLRAIERMAVYTQEKGGSPMDDGGFFLGAPVADPGPLYYLAALLLRLSPVVLVGLLLWLLQRAPGTRRGVGLTLLIGIGLVAGLAFLPKKADRYILPAIPFLIVVAAVGITALTERWRRIRPAGVAGLVVAVEVALLAMVWPYPLAAYNPVLGGGPTAARWISVGWGEGLDQLAPALNARPDAAHVTVSTPYPEVLQAQIAGRTVDLDGFDVADYAVRYIAASQRQLAAPSLEAALAGHTPLARAEIAGLPYAELYALDPPLFAGNIQPRHLAVSPGITERRGWVTIQVALGLTGADDGWPGPVLASSGAPLDVEAVLLNSADPTDVEATVTRLMVPDGSVSELKLRVPNSLGRYVVGLSIRAQADGAPLAVTAWPVGAPRLPDRMVFPSLSVRVQ